MNPFLAKSSDKNLKKEETIQEHTDKLIEEYNRLKQLYPNIKFVDWQILKLACLYHDLGKMNTKFQIKLGAELTDELDNLPEIPHGFLSPAFLPLKELKSKFTEEQLKILYQTIYYHHVRPKVENDNYIKITIKEDLEKYKNSFIYEKIGPIIKLYPSYSRYVNKRINLIDYNKKVFYTYVVTKGLLNKIDYAASGHILVEESNDNLEMSTKKYISHTLNSEINKLQKFMLENQNNNNIVIASTGIGKTEAALLWIGNNKGFFTLPLKVSINAIYDRIKEKIKFKKTALLHSDTYSEYLKRSKEDTVDAVYYEKTKQLSMPLTVCTLDQLIDFVFKYDGFELKLATLSYSKLVIDEIQMYSADLIAYLILALKYITESGGQFSIVTATLPSFIIELFKEEGIIFNEPKVFCKDIIRHKIKIYKKNIDIKEIRKNYSGKKVLVILNTVKEAQKLYKELKEELSGVNIHLFHSRFTKLDRNKKEDMIINMGQITTKETGIWITTQIVEASLDIDFDELYTELSDISGLFQRMGRVFRNREIKDNRINVHVYVGDEKRPSGVSNSEKSVVDVDIFDISKEVILKYDEQVLTEREKMRIVDEVYTKENLKDTKYYLRIKKVINHIKDIEEYSFEKNELKLREIFNEPIIPKSIYLANLDYIENNIEVIKNSKIREEREKAENRIRELTVDVPLYYVKEAYRKNLIEGIVSFNKYKEIKILDYKYDFEYGLIKDNSEKECKKRVFIL